MAIFVLIKTKVKNRKIMLENCQNCVKFGTFKKKFAKNAKKKKKICTFPVIKSSRGRKIFLLEKSEVLMKKLVKILTFVLVLFMTMKKVYAAEKIVQGDYIQAYVNKSKAGYYKVHANGVLKTW